MNLDQARTIIKTMHAKNVTNAEIAEQLLKKGYKSVRTGKPIGEYGVGHHIRAMAKEEAAPTPSNNKEKANGTPKRQGASRATPADDDVEALELAQKVLSGELTKEDRKALALLLLGK